MYHVLPAELPIPFQIPSVNPLLTSLNFCDEKSSVLSKEGPGNCTGVLEGQKNSKGPKMMSPAHSHKEAASAEVSGLRVPWAALTWWDVD